MRIMEDNLFTSHFLQHGTALVPFSAALAALGPPGPWCALRAAGTRRDAAAPCWYLRQLPVLVRCAADTGQSQLPLESFCGNQATSWLFFQTETSPMRDSPTIPRQQLPEQRSPRDEAGSLGNSVIPGHTPASQQTATPRHAR